MSSHILKSVLSFFSYFIIESSSWGNVVFPFLCFPFPMGLLQGLFSLVSPGSCKVLDCYLVLLSPEVLFFILPPNDVIGCFGGKIIDVVFITFLKTKVFHVWCRHAHNWFWLLMSCMNMDGPILSLGKNIFKIPKWIHVIVGLLSCFRQWMLSRFKHPLQFIF